MTEPNYIISLRAHAKSVAIITMATVILSLLLSLLRPIEYGSTIRLLVIQRSALTLDPYTALQSAERIGDNLSQVVYTSTFLDRVIHSGFDIDQSVFKFDERKRRKQWGKMVHTEVARGTGMLTVTVYHKDKNQATQIANGIAYVLSVEGWQYTGGDLQIKLVDAPLESRFPLKPNFLLNGSMGFVFGILLGFGYVFLGVDRKGHHKRKEEHPLRVFE